MLPDELLQTLNNDFPCRELQIRQLAALYSPNLPSPPIAVLHGLPATAKTSITLGVLRANRIPFSHVKSRECITGRHLLERAVSSALDALEEYYDESIDRKPYARCENISMLAVHLERMLEGRENKFVIVLDGIDRQREAPPFMFPALARFGERIPNLSLLLITTLPNPHDFHRPSLPYIHFPPYTRTETLHILTRTPPPIFLTPPDPEKYPDYTPDLAAEDDLWVWERFLTAVWDSIGKFTARDLLSFKAAATRLWRPFVQPIVDGTFGTRDFSRLMVHRRVLFQSEDALLDRIVQRKFSPAEKSGVASTAALPKQNGTDEHELPYYSKYLLLAAYLASYNPSRTDSTHFMHSTTQKRRKRRRTAAPGISRNRKIPRHLLSPSPFSLDRLLAIFRAIVEGPVPQSADLLTQVATLTSLRLLVRVGGSSAGDVLDAAARWRVGFGWEWVKRIGRGVGFELSEFVAGGME